MASTINLKEQHSLSGIQAEQGVLRGVKILGARSRNKRRYLPEAVSAALSLYQSVPVNIDHPDRPDASRRLRDRFGVLENVTFDGRELRGDLRYNPNHPLAGMVQWFAEHSPNSLGLSHNAVGSGHQRGGEFVVERISEVRAVDLVSDPATTKGLYESIMNNNTPEHDQSADTSLTEMGGYGQAELQEPDEDLDAIEPGGDEDMGGADHVEALVELIRSILLDPSLSAKDKKSKVVHAMKMLPKDEVEEEPDMEEPEEEPDMDAEMEPEEEDTEEECGSGSKSKKAMESVDYRELEYHRRKERARKICRQEGVPISEVFLSVLARAKSDKQLKVLIEDRKRVASQSRQRMPRSLMPYAGEGAGGSQRKELTTAEFVAEIRG